jgi:hypothetical protein
MKQARKGCLIDLANEQLTQSFSKLEGRGYPWVRRENVGAEAGPLL